MTVLQIYDEKETKENTMFGIKIKEFLIKYEFEGKEFTISKEDLINYYSIRFVGFNDNKEE